MQTMFITHDVFGAFGYGFGDLDALTANHFLFLISTLAAGIGQIFYAYRIFILSKSQILSIFIICILLPNFVASIFTGIYSFQAGSITRLTSRSYCWMHI
ncbi:hypothetical protein F5146DRAFT_223107 [Armillaria mellea]|nr:hypothetical protein F5146DRAFT_223107 [Armillaria mellea]